MVSEFLYHDRSHNHCFPTFCEFAARLSFAESDDGSTVPRKMDLYWFMPALVKRSVGSDKGTTGEEGTEKVVRMRLMEGHEAQSGAIATHRKYDHSP